MPQRYRDELPPQPPPIASAEQAQTSDGANPDDNNIQLSENCPDLLAFTTFRLMSWFYSGSNLKSLGELDRLVNEVILADDFQQKDFVGFSASRESERLDKHEDGPGSRLPTQDGWIETSVKISLPADGVKHRSEADAKLPLIRTPDVLEASSLVTSRTHLLRVIHSRRVHHGAGENQATTTRARL
jgi:hypothetical protein